METKPWWQSKTIWINVVALAVLLAGTQLGFEVTAEESGGILVVINLIMRAITGVGLTVK
jgi:hypothetical protein